ncbi:TPA: hypothetical protein ACKPY7_003123, partial [Serratia marcescens]
LTPGVKGGTGNGVLMSKLTGRDSCFRSVEDTDDLFIGKNASSWRCPHVVYEDITNVRMYESTGSRST